MADSGKVRLVRCPKCQNLLPELADYSVYQCGGCGAVLRAKNKPQETDYLSEKSDEGRAEGVSSKSEDLAEEGHNHLSDASDADVKSNTGLLAHCDQRALEEKEVSYDGMDMNQSKLKTSKLAGNSNLDMNGKRDNEVCNSKGREQEELISQNGSARGSQRSGKMPHGRFGERGKMEVLQRNTRSEVGSVGYSTLSHVDAGPSNYHANSSYSFGEPVRNHNDPDEVHRAQYLEQDRAELLRKLDELKDQLSRSCTNPKEKVPLNRSMAAPDWGHHRLPDGSYGSSQASMQFLGPDQNVPGYSYFNHCPKPFSRTNTHEMAMHGVYPSMNSSNHMPGYGDPFAPQMLRRGPQQLHGHYQQQPSHPYMPEQYIDGNPALYEQYPHNKVFHRPSCSCIQCYNKHHRAPLPVTPPSFGNTRFPDIAAFGPHAHNSRASVQLTSQAHTRWASDVNTEMGGFVHYRPQKVVLANGGRHFRPIAGGAPFITCNNCFELLQVPRKVLFMVKKEQKLQCGACSTVMDFAVVNKKLIISLPAEAKKSPTEVDDYYDEAVNNSTSYYHEPVKRTNLTFSSDDFDKSGYEFQSLDREPTPSTGKGLNSSKSQETQSFHSSSTRTSEDNDSPDVLVASGDGAHSIPLPVNAARSPQFPGSPLQEHMEFSSTNHAINRFGKGNCSSRSDHEKVMQSKIATRQNSVKEESLATEMEVSFNEYSNTGTSQDGREEDRPRTNKGSESFFANIMKKSFKDFSRSSQTAGEHGRSSVSVNGHPLSDRLVKKAEKLAGPIQPGAYWYDSRAGFWGCVGGPCLGIVPPFIEEFNYPIQENCAGGTTGVFVNGRELHQKDLDLLASRGLPTERDRSYIVEISGRVLDEDTGEEMDSLGRLAPTVEKVKHGFGMKPAKAVAKHV